MPDNDPSLEQNAALAEFAALRAEILARQGHQHTIMALNLTISGAIFSFALTQPARLLALLVVPVMAFMIGGRYIAQDYGIEECGIYIYKHLSRRVLGGLGWEEFVRQTRSNNRKQLYFGLDPLFIAFPGIATAAPAFCARPIWSPLRISSTQGILLMIAWIIGFLLAGILFRNVWKTRRHFILADWGRSSQGKAAPRRSARPKNLKASD